MFSIVRFRIAVVHSLLTTHLQLLHSPNHLSQQTCFLCACVRVHGEWRGWVVLAVLRDEGKTHG